MCEIIESGKDTIIDNIDRSLYAYINILPLLIGKQLPILFFSASAVKSAVLYHIQIILFSWFNFFIIILILTIFVAIQLGV